MKKLLFIAVLGLSAAFEGYAQDNDKMKVKDKDVPQAVQAAFKNQFANASDADWKMKNGSYKAKFKMNGTKHIAEFNSSGTLLSKGVKIENNYLPAIVSDAVKKNYPNSKVDDVYNIDKAGETRYLVELDGHPDKMVLFDSQGNVLKEKTD